MLLESECALVVLVRVLQPQLGILLDGLAVGFRQHRDDVVLPLRLLVDVPLVQPLLPAEAVAATLRQLRDQLRVALPTLHRCGLEGFLHLFSQWSGLSLGSLLLARGRRVGRGRIREEPTLKEALDEGGSTMWGWSGEDACARST